MEGNGTDLTKIRTRKTQKTFSQQKTIRWLSTVHERMNFPDGCGTNQRVAELWSEQATAAAPPSQHHVADEEEQQQQRELFKFLRVFRNKTQFFFFNTHNQSREKEGGLRGGLGADITPNKSSLLHLSQSGG